jgi:multidrug resistance protein, MATE family
MEAQSERTLKWEGRQLNELLRLAWPIAVSTLSYSIMTLVDTLLVGHLGPAALAGVGLGGTTAFTMICFQFGLLRGGKTLVAQAVGAGRLERVSAYRTTLFILAVALGLLTMLLGGPASLALLHVAASQETGQAAALYLVIRNLGAPITLAGMALRETRYGEGDARSPMVATLVANVVNLALAMLFVFAWHKGVRGAAWAAVIAQAVDVAMMLAMGRRRGVKFGAASWAHAREVWAIGVPTGLQFMLEVGAFLLLVLLLSSLSETQMAAHQIAIQCCQFAFLPALAVAEAAAVMAGQAVGARRQELVGRVAHLGLAVATVYTGFCTLVFAFGAQRIARGFTDDASLATVAVHLLWVAAVFQTFDGANIVARAILRGVGDVRFAAVVGVVTSWMLTPPLTWLLGYRAGLGAFGGWIGLCLETIVGAAILWRRLRAGQWRVAAAAARSLVEAPA